MGNGVKMYVSSTIIVTICWFFFPPELCFVGFFTLYTLDKKLSIYLLRLAIFANLYFQDNFTINMYPKSEKISNDQELIMIRN